VRDVDWVGVVEFGGDRPLDDLEVDIAFDGHLDDARAAIDLPHRPKHEWAADVLIVPIPPPSRPESLSGRVKRIDDLLHRARKGTHPGGTLCAMCHRDDHLGVLALEAIELKKCEKIAPELVGIGHDAPNLHFGLWQRHYAGGLPRRFGHFELPWLRVDKAEDSLYDIRDWQGDLVTTREHRWLRGRLERPLAALYDTFAQHLQEVATTGAGELLVVHHGDLQPQFFASGEDVRWEPRKSDLVEPVRAVREALRAFERILFVRANKRDGIVWSSIVQYSQPER
jgi:hypothetical protein